MEGNGHLARALADSLREAFEAGEIPAGTQLANEFALAEQLQVSRATLREAVRVLIHEGWLESRRGIGTFVRTRPATPVRGQLDTMSSMGAAIASTGAKPGVRDLNVQEIPATADLAQKLDIAPGAAVARICRTRLADDRAVAYATEYVKLSEAANFAAVKGFDGVSLYQFVRETLKLTLAYSRLSLTAVPAPREVAARLGLRASDPVLLMREVVFDAGGSPLLYTLNHHNTAIAEFTLLRYGRPA